ncbi:LysR family transcriptional regulator [Dictyobacter formicarum]|uniref:LysR family transcriptional regulator n=1 Tax=Dictyobacter formicarum TaxID=2778368 RepID=A0ABQ3VKX1_9CHLR|nr:LysR family transcriptional regulator [Dictyobacter formicarum]GHO86316.1 LysR family transcriptional regulator [Dictyobacter formicarum]
MELRQLVTFRMVAATLSFSRTAQSLNYVQSSVTAQIQTLEEELGVRLFDRLGKRIALTDAGKRFLPYVEKILDLSEEAREAVTDDDVPSGSLTISAPETLCIYRLPALLRLFRDRFPQVKVIFKPSPYEDLRRSVSDGVVDVAFVIDGPQRSTALMVEQLVSEPLLILVAPDHELAQLPSIQAQDLDGESFLLTEAGCSYRVFFERALNEEGVHPTTHLEFTSVEAIKQCVMASMGVAFLPEVTVAQEIAQGRLVALNWPEHNFHVHTQILWHKEKWLSPALNAFLTVTRECMYKPTAIHTHA